MLLKKIGATSPNWQLRVLIQILRGRKVPATGCTGKLGLVNMKREKMNQNNQKNGVCDLIVEITNSLKSCDLIGYSIYNGYYSGGTIIIDCLGRMGLDEVLDMLDKTAKRIQKVVDETKEATWKQSAIYEQIMQAPEASDEQKIKAFIKKTRYLDQLETLNSQLSLLYTLQIFAFKVKVLEVTVEKMNEQLVKSGILLKTGELDEVKKNIDALKILIEAQYESMKEIRETKTRALDYIK